MSLAFERCVSSSFITESCVYINRYEESETRNGKILHLNILFHKALTMATLPTRFNHIVIRYI